MYSLHFNYYLLAISSTSTSQCTEIRGPLSKGTGGLGENKNCASLEGEARIHVLLPTDLELSLWIWPHHLALHLMSNNLKVFHIWEDLTKPQISVLAPSCPVKSCLCLSCTAHILNIGTSMKFFRKCLRITEHRGSPSMNSASSEPAELCLSGHQELLCL